MTETNLEREPRPNRWRLVRRYLKRQIIVLLIGLVLYVLSIGPMFWSWYEGRHLGGSHAVVVFYEPLRYACMIPRVEDAVNAYISWWNL